MTRHFFTLLLLASIPFTGFAQASGFDYTRYQKHELTLQYGTPTFQEINTQLRDDTVTDDAGHTLNPSSWRYTGVGALGYNYYLNPFLSFGAYFGISGTSMELYDDTNEMHQFIAKSNITSYTGMLGANYIYFHRGLLDLSGSAFLGLIYKNEELTNQTPGYPMKPEQPWGFAFHLTFCRVRVGNTIGGFAEVGMGYKGIVNVGLSVRM